MPDLVFFSSPKNGSINTLFPNGFMFFIDIFYPPCNNNDESYYNEAITLVNPPIYSLVSNSPYSSYYVSSQQHPYKLSFFYLLYIISGYSLVLCTIDTIENMTTISLVRR